ncbi:GntR family transcriptional regulator / MocR family aminotransferase [Flaviramulus basaltis]|uniref:GntR family transcriptional regulator / MocR family aminotransferase n=1 Tax=Flaviramulus basaltis TaxID=369401 RepID=A0A1K2ITS2_9FLAO|nr:PLP-dependent aminotransferase family protein [Flaviramulus basaltis]SFZ95123.1 GntR family transcriptional regulator / MocR family aminotransferase [Flaviramulus basaltis]
MNTNNKFTIQRIQKEYVIQTEQKPYNKYIVLYRAIKQCILNIELPHNWLLPSTRILSQELDLSRTTVIKAYELLLLEKLVISKTGSGNRINFEGTINSKKNNLKQLTTNNNLYPDISQRGQSYLKNTVLLNRLPNDNIAFRPGLPPLDTFPVNQWKKLLNTYWRHIKSSGLSYSQSTGQKELKKSISNYLNISRNVKCDPEQIVIVSGSLQSLYLIASTIINSGDAVVLENPLFPNVHSVFKSSEAKLIPIDLDDEGISIKVLNSIKKDKPKLIHTTPSNHYPLGVKMSLKRRQEILQWASENKALIIENDYENEIANSTSSIPTIYSLDTEDRTIYMGTFNRLLHPSIRLGYMIVPKYLTSAVEALQEHSHRFVSPSIQIVMNQFIEKNYLYQHIKNCIEVAKERHDLFISEFEALSKNMYIQKKPFSSFHLIAYFKTPVSVEYEKEVIRKLNEHNITTFSLSKCYIGKPKQQGLIIGYSSVRPTILKRKIKKMIDFI